eukprot:1806955-Rhodomonas_salina.1
MCHRFACGPQASLEPCPPHHGGKLPLRTGVGAAGGHRSRLLCAMGRCSAFALYVLQRRLRETRGRLHAFHQHHGVDTLIRGSGAEGQRVGLLAVFPVLVLFAHGRYRRPLTPTLPIQKKEINPE